MPQFVAGGTQCDQVFRVVGTAGLARNDVVDFQESGVAATLAATVMSIAGQNFAANSRWNCGFVANTWLVDMSVASGGLKLGFC